MSGPWSVEQREWLQALGHSAMVLATSAVHDARPVEAVIGVPERSTPPSAMKADVATEGSTVRSQLHRALLKATGRTGAEAEQVLRQLEVDPGAPMAAPDKRALWPRLRQLRGRPE